MIKTIRICDCCKKEIAASNLHHFVCPTIMPEQLELDICDECYRSFTYIPTENSSQKQKDLPCKYEDERVVYAHGPLWEKELVSKSTICLGTRECDPCVGHDKCDHYKPEEE